MHNIILESTETIIKHSFMYVSEIEVEIKLILSTNLEEHYNYRKYASILHNSNNISSEKCNNILVMPARQLAQYANNTENINRFDIKKNITQFLKTKFGESVRNRGNKLFIKKLLICENKEDIYCLYSQLMNNIYQHLNCYVI